MAREPSPGKVGARVASTRLAITCKVPALVAAQSSRLRQASFTFPSTWAAKVGLWLDVPDVDWEQVEVCRLESYRTVAPKKVLEGMMSQR